MTSWVEEKFPNYSKEAKELVCELLEGKANLIRLSFSSREKFEENKKRMEGMKEELEKKGILAVADDEKGTIVLQRTNEEETVEKMTESGKLIIRKADEDEFNRNEDEIRRIRKEMSSLMYTPDKSEEEIKRYLELQKKYIDAREKRDLFAAER